MDSSTSKTDLFHQGNLAGSVSKDDATFGEDLSTGFLDDAAKDAVGNGRSSSNFAGRGEEVLHVFSAASFDNALSRAWETLEPAANFKLPWESGIWDNIFGPSTRASCVTLYNMSRPPVVPVPEPVPVLCPPAKCRRVADGPHSWHQVVLASDVATWQE